QPFPNPSQLQPHPFGPNAWNCANPSGVNAHGSTIPLKKQFGPKPANPNTGNPNGPKKNPSSKSKSPSNPNPNPQWPIVSKHGCALKCGVCGVATMNGEPFRGMPSKIFRIGGAPPAIKNGPRAAGSPIRRIGILAGGVTTGWNKGDFAGG